MKERGRRNDLPQELGLELSNVILDFQIVARTTQQRIEAINAKIRHSMKRAAADA